MKKQILTIIAMALIISCNGPVKKKIEYPLTKTGDVIDTYFGTKVPDPYRWLEDDRSEETAAWVKEQNKVTFGYLEKIPYREELKRVWKKCGIMKNIQLRTKKEPIPIFHKNDGLQNQFVIYRQKDNSGSGNFS